MGTIDNLTTLQEIWDGKVDPENLRQFYINQVKRRLRKPQGIRRLFHRASQPLIIDIIDFSEKSHFWYMTPDQIEKYPNHGNVDTKSITNLISLVDEQLPSKDEDTEKEIVDWGCYDGKKSIEIAKHTRAKKLHLVDNPFALVSATQNCTAAGIKFSAHERDIRSGRLFEAGGKKKIHLFVGNTISNFGRGKNLESILEHLSLQMDIGADLIIEWTNHPKEYYEGGFGFMRGYLTTMDPTIATENLEFKVDSSSEKEHVLYFELKNEHSIKDGDKLYKIPSGTKMVVARIQRFQDDLVGIIEKYGFEAKTLNIEHGQKDKVLGKAPYRYAIFKKVSEYHKRRYLLPLSVALLAGGLTLGGYLIQPQNIAVCDNGKVFGAKIHCIVGETQRKLDIADLENLEIESSSMAELMDPKELENIDMVSKVDENPEGDNIVVRAKVGDAKYKILITGRKNIFPFLVYHQLVNEISGYLQKAERSRCYRPRTQILAGEEGLKELAQYIVDCTDSRKAAIQVGFLKAYQNTIPDSDYMGTIIERIMYHAHDTQKSDKVIKLANFFYDMRLISALNRIQEKMMREKNNGSPKLVESKAHKDPLMSAIDFLFAAENRSNWYTRTAAYKLALWMGESDTPLENFSFLPILTTVSSHTESDEYYRMFCNFSSLMSAVEEGYTVSTLLYEGLIKYRYLEGEKILLPNIVFQMTSAWVKMHFLSPEHGKEQERGSIGNKPFLTKDKPALYALLLGVLVDIANTPKAILRDKLFLLYNYTELVSYPCVQEEIDRLCSEGPDQCRVYIERKILTKTYDITNLLRKDVPTDFNESLPYKLDLCKKEL